MSTNRLAFTVLLVIALLAPGASASLAQPAASQAAAASATASGSMLFIENAGQWPPSTSSGSVARFQVWGSPLGAGTTWLAEDAIWLVVGGGERESGSMRDEEAFSPSPSRPLSPSPQTAIKLTFPGSNPDVRIEPFDPLTTTVSYFIGNEPEQWHPAVPVWGGVRYVDLYPGVDLLLGGRDGRWQMKAASDAAVEQVRVQIEGADLVNIENMVLHLDAAGRPLAITLPSAPFAYQATCLSRGETAQTLTLYPDPHPTQSARPADDPGNLLYGTFLGGSDSDLGKGIAIDGAGNAYVTGGTSSSDFPTTPGAFDPILINGDAFVVKLNSTGGGLAYATFLGGYWGDGGNAIALDGTGNVYVTGVTGSDDFPSTPGAFDTSHNGSSDVFVVKLNPTGSGLTYSTFLGNSGAESGVSIAVNSTGHTYVTGTTNSINFPTTPGAIDQTHNGGDDSFVVKLNPAGSALVYGTFLGGSEREQSSGIAVDATGSTYVTGSTYSSNFPTTPGAFDPNHGGYVEGFVAKLNPAGSGLAYATFLGCGITWSRAISVDSSGSAYMTGLTNCTVFPTTPGAFDTSFNGSGEAFVAKLNSAGSRLTYGTFLGGTGYDGGFAIAVDATGNAYVTGETGSADFPTTPGTFDPSFSGGYYNDAFVARLNPTGNELAYATFMGGSDYDSGYAIATGTTGIAYVTGETRSSDFPASSGAFDSSYNGRDDAFVTKLATQPVEPYTPNVVAPIEQPNSGAFVSGTVTLRGFAIDRASDSGTGIDRMSIYLDGPFGTGTHIGDPTYGINRPDVAAQYGARFGPSGWELAWNTTGLAPGSHQLYLYAHRTTDNAWSRMPPHLVLVRGGYLSWLPIAVRNQ